MGRHEQADTFDAVVSDYVTGRARELVRQVDEFNTRVAGPVTSVPLPVVDWYAWIGAAAEILRELTRDA